MGKRSVIASCFWLGVFITSIHSLEEGKDTTLPADIIISDSISLKKIEIRNPSNSPASLPESPTVIQQGNNVYIKPKFIFRSPFNSYRQESKSDNNCCDNVSVTPKLPDEETNTVIGKPSAPQVPTVVVPPLNTPPNVEDDILILPPRFPAQPQTPIVIPNPSPNKPWLKMPSDCPRFVTPMSPKSPQLPKFPTEKRPEWPEVIPKPPELPPLILPKLPIEIIFRRPIITKLPGFTPIPQQPINAPPLCPPMIKCILSEKNVPSTPNIFSNMFENFKNIITLPNRIDLSKLLAPDENDFTPDFPVAYPTMCAQGIIAERLVPNIVENNDVKVIMTPIFPSLFTHTGNYQEQKLL